MLKNKRASTLVMTLFMLAFVVIIGTSIVLLAGTSAKQTATTIEQQQADFTAKAVLDAVVAKIKSGEIDPAAIESQGLDKLSGSGVDDELGSFDISIEPYDAIDSHTTYKITVSAQYQGATSDIYTLISAIYSQTSEAPAFDVFALGTGFAETENYFTNSGVQADICLDNGGETLSLAGSGYITGNIDIIGGLSLYGSFISGTEDEGNTVNATEDIQITGSAVVYADVNSEKGVSITGSGKVFGDIKANEDVTLSSYVEGDIYTNGKVTVTGGATLDGNIYASGDILLSGGPTINGAVYSQGNVIIAQATVKDGIYAKKSVALTGNSNCDIYAEGDIDVSSCSQVKSLNANGTIYIYNSTINSNITARDDVFIGQNKSGSTSYSAVNADIATLGRINVNANSPINGNITAGGDVLLDSGASLTGDLISNGSVTVQNNSRFSGSVRASGDFTLLSDSTGNVLIGGDAEINNAKLTGNLTAKGNALLIHASWKSCVSGIVTLGGELDSESNNTGTYKSTIIYTDPDNIEDVEPVDDIASVVAFTDINDVPLVALDIQITAPAWEVPADIRAQIAQTTITVHFKDTSSAYYTINGDEHIIDQNCTLILDDLKWDKKLVLDATDHDVYVMLKTSSDKEDTVSITNGVDILSKGEYNVFILLDDGAGNYVNFDAGSNSFIGYYNYLYGVPNPDPRIPNLFIICNAQGLGSEVPTISFNNYNSLYGFVYAPYAAVNFAGSALMEKKLYGAVVASNISLGSGRMQYTHYVPDLSEYAGSASGGQSGSTETEWVNQGIYLSVPEDD